MPKDSLVDMCKETILIAHKNVKLSKEDSYDVLLSQVAHMSIFLQEHSLWEDFHEWMLQFVLDVEIEKKAINKIDEG